MSLTVSPIGKIKTPYKEKFAIPRQPGLATAALGVIEFEGACNDPNLLRGIEQFSHLWLIFQFHQTTAQGWSPLVRPPRLGGNEKLGVLATRSTFRPNNLGLSVVEFVDSEFRNGQLTLTVKGTDLLCGTPIVDIKPYIPYADSISDAQAGYANEAPLKALNTVFSDLAAAQIQQHEKSYPQFKSLIEQVLAQDPRPAFHRSHNSERVYGTRLYDFDVRWQVINNVNHVMEVILAEGK